VTLHHGRAGRAAGAIVAPGPTDEFRSGEPSPLATTRHRGVDMPKTKTTITTIRTVAIPAADQDRSVAFFVDALGFEKRLDAQLAEGFRWIEVAPPGSPVSVAIVTASSALPAGVDTGIRFVTTDAERERTSMKDAGVEVGEMLRWPNVPAMFSFRDVDGNTYYLAESAS
jgi:catechol 2,3-dioxygenase-like lactoylglutathione lyase family enzyme